MGLFHVIQSDTPDAPIPLLDWLRAANEHMGGDGLERRQLCVFWSGFGEPTDTPNIWRAATIRRVDKVTGTCEIKYHDDRRKTSRAFVYLPLAVLHFARCPPQPGTVPRTAAEGYPPLPPSLPMGPLPPSALHTGPMGWATPTAHLVASASAPASTGRIHPWVASMAPTESARCQLMTQPPWASSALQRPVAALLAGRGAATAAEAAPMPCPTAPTAKRCLAPPGEPWGPWGHEQPDLNPTFAGTGRKLMRSWSERPAARGTLAKAGAAAGAERGDVPDPGNDGRSDFGWSPLHAFGGNGAQSGPPAPLHSSYAMAASVPLPAAVLGAAATPFSGAAGADENPVTFLQTRQLELKLPSGMAPMALARVRSAPSRGGGGASRGAVGASGGCWGDAAVVPPPLSFWVETLDSTLAKAGTGTSNHGSGLGSPDGHFGGFGRTSTNSSAMPGGSAFSGSVSRRGSADGSLRLSGARPSSSSYVAAPATATAATADGGSYSAALAQETPLWPNNQAPVLGTPGASMASAPGPPMIRSHGLGGVVGPQAGSVAGLSGAVSLAGGGDGCLRELLDDLEQQDWPHGLAALPQRPMPSMQLPRQALCMALGAGLPSCTMQGAGGLSMTARW